MRFGKIMLGFPDGGYVSTDNEELNLREAAQMRKRGELITVRPLFATGSGLQFLYRDEEEFLPYPVTRGARAATQAEIDAAPAWVQQAYQWYLSH